MEDDFKRLHRQYQFLEQNRKDYATDSANTIGRQQKILEKLKNDNEYLKAEYRNYMKRPHGKGVDKMGDIQDQIDIYDQRMEIEESNCKELKAQCDLIKDKILTLRRQMGGVNAAKESQQMIQKQIRILENRLDKALVKFNEALATNKTLRETIDNLRRERVVFDNIYRKLEKELHEKKKQMAAIIEMSNQAYEARDQAQMEVAVIEQQNAKEGLEYEEQMSNFRRLIEKDKIKKDALSPSDKRGEMSIEQEKNLKTKVTRSAWTVAKDKANVQVSIEKVQSYEEAFYKIKGATGIADIDELVTIFIANEDQNFSLFNYVSGQANEIEKLEEQIAVLQEEENKYTQETGEDNSQHEQLRKELQTKLELTNAAIEKYEQKHAECTKTVNSLKVGIHSIFNKIECSSSSMSDMLSGETVTEANMMQYLGMIEQRTNEILQMWCLHTHKNRADPVESLPSPTSPTAQQAMANILGLGPQTPMVPTTEKIKIAPPTMEEYSDMDADESDNEVDQIPHKLDQIKTEVLRYMSQKSVSRDPRVQTRTRDAAPGRGTQRRKVF